MKHCRFHNQIYFEKMGIESLFSHLKNQKQQAWALSIHHIPALAFICGQ
jgi:hypothetical protein